MILLGEDDGGLKLAIDAKNFSGVETAGVFIW